jgi:hypothetical protein
VDNVSCVAGEGSEEGPVSVHYDETEFGIGFEQFRERLRVEFVVAEVERAEEGGRMNRKDDEAQVRWIFEVVNGTDVLMGL